MFLIEDIMNYKDIKLLITILQNACIRDDSVSDFHSR